MYELQWIPSCPIKFIRFILICFEWIQMLLDGTICRPGEGDTPSSPFHSAYKIRVKSNFTEFDQIYMKNIFIAEIKWRHAWIRINCNVHDKWIFWRTFTQGMIKYFKKCLTDISIQMCHVCKWAYCMRQEKWCCFGKNKSSNQQIIPMCKRI